jgi:hypothetical protein
MEGDRILAFPALHQAIVDVASGHQLVDQVAMPWLVIAGSSWREGSLYLRSGRQVIVFPPTDQGHQIGMTKPRKCAANGR